MSVKRFTCCNEAKYSHLEVMNSIRALTFSFCSAVVSISLRREGDMCDRAVPPDPPVPRLMLEEVELVLRPESVTGDGWQSGRNPWPPEGTNENTIYSALIVAAFGMLLPPSDYILSKSLSKNCFFFLNDRPFAANDLFTSVRLSSRTDL